MMIILISDDFYDKVITKNVLKLPYQRNLKNCCQSYKQLYISPVLNEKCNQS